MIINIRILLAKNVHSQEQELRLFHPTYSKKLDTPYAV